jgi:hypothetical protein
MRRNKLVVGQLCGANSLISMPVKQGAINISGPLLHCTFPHEDVKVLMSKQLSVYLLSSAEIV